MKHRKQLTALAGILTAVLLLSACGANSGGAMSGGGSGSDSMGEDAAPQKISAQQAYERMASGDGVTIVDVRQPDEYETAHIPGAILLPNEDLGSERPAALPVLDAEILIYCRSGNRSAQAAAKLAAMGYTNLYDFGGINDWTYETETGPWSPEPKAGTLDSFQSWDLNGQVVDERIFSGYQLTMINLWGTFCGPCLREMPELGQLAQDYADRGVQVMGVVVDVQTDGAGGFRMDQIETARELVSQTGADYPHLLPSSDLYTAKLREVSAVPETIFVDSEGNLVGQSYVGSRSGSQWAEIMDSLLKEMGA